MTHRGTTKKSTPDPPVRTGRSPALWCALAGGVTILSIGAGLGLVVGGSRAIGARLAAPQRPAALEAAMVAATRPPITRAITRCCSVPASTKCGSPDCLCSVYGEPEDQPVLSMGQDENGHHWIGALESHLIVEVFTDYECPFCHRAHLQLRAIIAQNPRGVRLVHRDYPLDHHCNSAIEDTFHDQACVLSRIAYCAGEQGRFWEMNDYLLHHADAMEHHHLTAIEAAAHLQLDRRRFACCMAADETTDHLQADIEAGQKHQLSATPAYVVEGEVYYGQLPARLLAKQGGSPTPAALP